MNYIIIIIFVIFSCSSHAIESDDTSGHDDTVSRMKQAIKFIEQGEYKDIEKIIYSDPLMQDLVLWLRYNKSVSDVSFSELTQFIKKHPTWPKVDILRKEVEKKNITDINDNNKILNWFARNPPVSHHGNILYAQAQLSFNPQCATCLKHIRKAWITGDYTSSQEKEFLSKYGHRLNKIDHNKRVEYLLCHYKAGNYDKAHRIMKYASTNYKYLIEAHKQTRNQGKYTALIEKNLPPHMKKYPCILMEKIRWHNKAGNDTIAQNLLLENPTLHKSVPNVDQLWRLKHIQIRHLIRDKDYKKAYKLSINHGLTGGSNFADAHWLAGWISLRFLDDPQRAYKHFEILYKKVSYAVSLSRGAYWAGRSAEQMGNKALVGEWYKKASKFSDTYYGQLAQLRSKPDSIIKLPPVAKHLQTDITNYQNNEFVKIAYILLKLGQVNNAEKFLVSVMLKTKSPGERTLIAQLPYHLGYKPLGVIMSKKISYHGFSLPDYIGYPRIPQDKYKLQAEEHVVESLIRQESNYNAHVKSGAGAIGLMQLMPPTARMVARQIKMPYSKNKLYSANYNIKLGDNYFKCLLDKYDGSYILAIASYDAGEGKVKEWVERNGDPRDLDDIDDVIDWIEKVSYEETRTYLQRLLSNMQIYKSVIARENHSKENLENIYTVDSNLMPKISDMYGDLVRGRKQDT